MDVTSDTAHLAPVRRAVEAFVADAGFDPAAIAGIGLTVNEAMANVIRHAYRGAAGRPIAVAAECDSAGLRVTIRDWGSGVNPEDLPARPRDPATPGGLGLICLRSLMDAVVYTPQPDGMLLTMHKARATSGDGDGTCGRVVVGQTLRDPDPERP